MVKMTEAEFDQSSAGDSPGDRAARRLIEIREHAKEVYAAVKWMRQQTEAMIQEADDG
jgi:hypothetical protein